MEKLRKLKPTTVFNALHGKYGEDGFVQSILELLKIPYTHSGVYASSLAMDKELSRLIFKKHKMKVPKYFLLQKDYEDNLDELRDEWEDWLNDDNDDYGKCDEEGCKTHKLYKTVTLKVPVEQE